jgi:predicted CoA-substrate-specific enzyme activase
MKQISTGIDIGSCTTKIVTLSGMKMVDARILPTGHDPMNILQNLAGELKDGTVVATGYGRRLAQTVLPCSTVTEIRAGARAARHLCPEAESVIDIGGQDAKAIELSGTGFGAFEMNDRCAAGTGRFFEMMAKVLGYSLEEFGGEALRADSPILINSMCTVFAESEVVSLIARGEDRRRIALGLHQAVSRRIAAMASRILVGGRTLFIGGVANNIGMKAMLSDELGHAVEVPERPEFAVALGAALIGQE